MRWSELEKLAKAAGCYLVREGKEHEIWASPKTGKKFQMSRHKREEVATGTLGKIKKDAGLK